MFEFGDLVEIRVPRVTAQPMGVYERSQYRGEPLPNKHDFTWIQCNYLGTDGTDHMITHCGHVMFIDDKTAMREWVE